MTAPAWITWHWLGYLHTLSRTWNAIRAAAANLPVTITLDDSSVLMGTLATDPNNPQRSFVRFL